jgi:hypothetical protein
MYKIRFIAKILSLLLLSDAAFASGADPQAVETAIAWLDDYHAGMELAQARRKLAFVWFYDASETEATTQFERQVLLQPAVMDLLAERCIAIRLPVDATVATGGLEVALLDHPAFAEMQRAPGIALLDMTDDQSPNFRHVVSVYPFTSQSISADKLAVMLDLPLGTLTQRTLIFAVRTHPEQPASARSHYSPLLARETESHAVHQATLTLQGHHQWESRFHSINAQLPGGLVTQEVCAESWPGQSLVEAAEECVHSWRQSSGHWEAVSRRHVLFGYDMKRGRNGVWYAAGIFAHRL